LSRASVGLLPLALHWPNTRSRERNEGAADPARDDQTANLSRVGQPQCRIERCRPRSRAGQGHDPRHEAERELEGELGVWDRLHPSDDEPVRDRVLLALGRGVRRLGHVGPTIDPVRDRRPGVIGDRLDEPAHAQVLADRDGKADTTFRQTATTAWA